jgi:hypothetical protein
LGTYSRFARELDDEYRNYHARNSRLTADALKAVIELPFDLDDAAGPTAEELQAETGVSEEPAGPGPTAEAKTEQTQSSFFDVTKFRIFGGGGSNKNKKQEIGQGTAQPKWKELPQGVAWCFQERHLSKKLKILRSKIDDLNMMGANLVRSVDLESNIGREMQGGIAFKDFVAHRSLQKKAEDYVNGVQGTYLPCWARSSNSRHSHYHGRT